jgi:hypothetical protein
MTGFLSSSLNPGVFSPNSLIFTFVDSFLKKREAGFIRSLAELMQEKQIYFLFESDSFRFVYESIILSSPFSTIELILRQSIVITSSFEEFEMLSKEGFQALHPICPSSEPPNTFQAGIQLALKLSSRLVFFIFKLSSIKRTQEILDAASLVNEQPLVFCPDPFNIFFSGNILALKEGSLLVLDVSEVIDPALQ